MLEVIDAVAERLGNTRATCREFYIHPALLESFEEGELDAVLADLEPEESDELRPEERVLLAWLRTIG